MAPPECITIGISVRRYWGKTRLAQDAATVSRDYGARPWCQALFLYCQVIQRVAETVLAMVPLPSTVSPSYSTAA
jgi:hypothetical protein